MELLSLLTFVPGVNHGNKIRSRCADIKYIIGLDWIGFTSGYSVSTALRIVYWPTLLSFLGISINIEKQDMGLYIRRISCSATHLV